MSPDGFQQSDRGDAVDRGVGDRIVEQRAHPAETGEIVDFVGTHGVQDFAQIGPRDQVDLITADGQRRRDGFARPIEAVHVVPFGPQQFRQVISILSGDSRHESDPGHATFPRR